MLAACGKTAACTATKGRDNYPNARSNEVEITIDGQKLEPVPGQTVLAHGPDRNLSVDEVGGIQLVENESPALVRG